MKKYIVLSACGLFLTLNSYANDLIPFYEAIKTCQKYNQTGAVTKQNQTFNIQVTLDKTKGNKCIYREKIFQGKEYQMLTCDFEQYQLDSMSKLMKDMSTKYASEISKNKIHGAKLTNNVEILETYLANPAICKITYSRQK